MSKLNFIGCGNFNNTELGNNCAYYAISNEELILFDCGGDVFQKLLKTNLIYKGLKKLIICITHCHDDHIGSLSSLLHYMKIYYPNTDVSICTSNAVAFELKNILSIMGNENIPMAGNCISSNFELYSFNTEHVDYCNSCGFILLDKTDLSNNIVHIFSGDTNDFIGWNAIDILLEQYCTLKDTQKVYIYHDASTRLNKVHIFIYTLISEYIKFRNRYKNKFDIQLVCMHIEDKDAINNIIDAGSLRDYEIYVAE